MESENGTVDKTVSSPEHKYSLSVNTTRRNPNEQSEHTRHENLTKKQISAREGKEKLTKNRHRHMRGKKN